MFERRSREQESMDDFSLANDELRKNLDELELFNKWLGSRHTLITALDKVLKRYPDKFRQDGMVIADLGCGSGDLTISIFKWAKNRNIHVKIIGIDANPFMVDYAARKSRLNDAVEYKVMDIVSPEISQMRFDVVTISSVCHHFEDDTLVDLFKQLYRQTRLAIIVNDLQRHWFSYYCVKWLTKILNFSSLAKKDGPLSVLRGFSSEDLISLLKSAGLAKYEIRWTLAFRWQVIIWCMNGIRGEKMKDSIRTDRPILADREKITQTIAKFWDKISEGWKVVWGPHIHHGYYENNQPLTPLKAQEKLIVKLAELVEITPNARVLDVGCGMGGSSIHLAKNDNALVTGITLSPKQVEIASRTAEENNIKNVSFKIEDALLLESFDDNSFDIIWSLESCEQFFDKNMFIKQAYRVLKPGGKLMLATWCSSRDEYEGDLAKKYQALCLAFDLPYMPTIECYRNFLTAENFSIKLSLDWSMFVKKSWDVGVSLINAYSFTRLLKMGGWRGLRFAKQIKLMQEAFYQNRVRYGVFLAIK